VWTAISENLRQVESPKFNVDQRSVRDHYKLLEKKYIRKRNGEEKATGISVGEESELEKGIADIIQRFKDFDLQHTQESQTKMNKQTEKGKLLKNYIKHLWKHSVRHKIVMVR